MKAFRLVQSCNSVQSAQGVEREPGHKLRERVPIAFTGTSALNTCPTSIRPSAGNNALKFCLLSVIHMVILSSVSTAEKAVRLRTGMKLYVSSRLSPG